MKTHLSPLPAAVIATAFACMAMPLRAAPEIEILHAGRSLKDGRFTASYGEVLAGSQSTAATFVIRNRGSSTLKKLSVKIGGSHTGDFLVTQPSKTKLSPGARASFKVRFAPLATGLRKAQLRIISNDADENPFRINLKGAGTSPPPPPVHNWAGNWESNWGSMIITQNGTTVTGTYAHDNGRITGTVQGDQLIGTWSEAPSYAPPNDAGDIIFTLSADGKSFTGQWRYGSSGEMSGGWNGTKVE